MAFQKDKRVLFGIRPEHDAELAEIAVTNHNSVTVLHEMQVQERLLDVIAALAFLLTIDVGEKSLRDDHSLVAELFPGFVCHFPFV